MHYIVQFIQSVGVEAKDDDEAMEKALLVIDGDPQLLTPGSMEIEVSQN